MNAWYCLVPMRPQSFSCFAFCELKLATVWWICSAGLYLSILSHSQNYFLIHCDSWLILVFAHKIFFILLVSLSSLHCISWNFLIDDCIKGISYDVVKSLSFRFFLLIYLLLISWEKSKKVTYNVSLWGFSFLIQVLPMSTARHCWRWSCPLLC